ADRDERIDRLQASRHRLMHGFPRNDTRRLDVHTHPLVGLDRALAVDRVSQRVDDATEQALADRRVDDGAGALDGLAFLDLTVVAEDHDADVVDFEVERHAAHAVLKLDHLARLHVVETVDAGDAVADRQHLADFGDFRLLTEILDLVLQDRCDFCGADIHQPASFIACLIAFSLVRSEESTIREPSLTVSPPIIAGSILTWRSTDFSPVIDLRALLIASRWASDNFSAAVTSAVTSPFHLATSLRKSRMISPIENSRRLLVTNIRKFKASPPISALASTAASARLRSSAPYTGLRTRRLRSALSATMAANFSMSAFT